ncbi:hypothetical protein ABIA52_000064 [Paenarthrobacter histidinolovorans]|uniref:Uncharacterized protein n=1 Tax=Paenarthrobacter histidinolovorans TaxID=43664 RepID=A0ABW8N3E0_9MICC
MDSQTNRDSGARMLVCVQAELLHDLTSRYARYRTAIAGPWDPVETLALTGDVLRAVHRLINVTGQATRPEPQGPGHP